MAAPTLGRQLATVADRLSAVYGRPRRSRTDPLDGLIQTVLSQNTSDRNSDRAFAALKARFPGWEAVARARVAQVESAIRSGGLARLKSRRIRRILRDVRDREGGYDLRSLRRLAPSEVARRLDALPGVGPKTRACVQLFSCGQPAFPVDTHVHRIVRRLGLVPAAAGAAAAQQRLEPHVPTGRALDLHLNLIRLGREVCRPRGPRCPDCPLQRVCAHARGRRR